MELSWSCTDCIRAEMLIGRLVGSSFGSLGDGRVGCGMRLGVVRLAGGYSIFLLFFLLFFGHVNRNRNRIEFHLINAVGYARPNCVKCVVHRCTCCYLTWACASLWTAICHGYFIIIPFLQFDMLTHERMYLIKPKLPALFFPKLLWFFLYNLWLELSFNGYKLGTIDYSVCLAGVPHIF